MFGWISKRQHMREITRARETYRWEADQKMAEAERLIREYERKLAELVHAEVVQDSANGWSRRRILISVDDLFTSISPRQYDFERLARRIIDGLMRLNSDSRPDMRQAMPQGIGGPEYPSRMPL